MSGIGEQLLCSPWFHAAVGVSVGVGLMILVLAKWGRKFLIGESGPENGDAPTIQRLWKKINEMEQRQVDLRTELPRDYVRTGALDKLEKGQQRIESKLDHFMEDCRRGDCAAGKMKREVI